MAKPVAWHRAQYASVAIQYRTVCQALHAIKQNLARHVGGCGNGISSRACPSKPAKSRVAPAHHVCLLIRRVCLVALARDAESATKRGKLAQSAAIWLESADLLIGKEVQRPEELLRRAASTVRRQRAKRHGHAGNSHSVDVCQLHPHEHFRCPGLERPNQLDIEGGPPHGCIRVESCRVANEHLVHDGTAGDTVPVRLRVAKVASKWDEGYSWLA
mmetsp:Transcript_42172/g.111021  ORF Transcript_42172/g.111021 Transcript_42172/m.111021 type:complete len:216 (+) Transcript_42172:270-917(+)